jgi:hypothetical protein
MSNNEARLSRGKGAPYLVLSMAVNFIDQIADLSWLEHVVPQIRLHHNTEKVFDLSTTIGTSLKDIGNNFLLLGSRWPLCSPTMRD